MSTAPNPNPTTDEHRRAIIVLTLTSWDGKTAPVCVARLTFDYGLDKAEAQERAHKAALEFVGADAEVTRCEPDEDCPHWARSYERGNWARSAGMMSLAGEAWHYAEDQRLIDLPGGADHA
jgi:hypothetical protein